MYSQQTSECFFTKVLIHVNCEQKELTQVNLKLLTLMGLGNGCNCLELAIHVSGIP